MKLLKKIKNWYYLKFSKTYRIFIEKMIDTPSEIWFMDGERVFTKKEKYFLELFDSTVPKIKYHDNEFDIYPECEHPPIEDFI